jgi:hypothetical protein
MTKNVWLYPQNKLFQSKKMLILVKIVQIGQLQMSVVSREA